MQKKLLFGFELEGAISRRLGERLENGGELGGGELKTDGSVRITDEDIQKLRNHSRYSNQQGDRVSEYASKIFDSAEEMLELLAKFKLPDYVYNNSCGFHLHIGIVGSEQNQKWLKAMATDFEFVSQLQKESNNFCKCQSDRNASPTAGQRYARQCENGGELLRLYHSPDKFTFMNYHSQGTLEFRFLSPCEHKVENAKKVIEAVEKQLKKTIKSHNEYEVEPEVRLEWKK